MSVRSMHILALTAAILMSGAARAQAPTVGLHAARLPGQEAASPAAVEPEEPQVTFSGEDCGSAIPIGQLPFTDYGNTCELLDDYDEVCPYTGSTSPDVAYSYAAGADITVDLTLCTGMTDYDTKLYIYEGSCPGVLVACNDDACSSPYYVDPYVSELLGVALTAGHTYFIIVDGYGGDCGSYTLAIAGAQGPPPECPPEALFGQPAHLPSGQWTMTASDAYAWGTPLCYENVPALASPVGGVHWWGVMMESEAECVDSDPTFEIKFYEDFDAEPGPEICSYTATATITPTGVIYGDWFELQYFTVDTLEPCCDLPSGGWVSIQGFGDAACEFYWLSSGAGDGLSWHLVDGESFSEPYDLSVCLLECPYEDCNDNGIPDEDDLADCQGEPWCSDCNENEVLDVCDIAGETSMDCQPDGVPDECQLVENDCNENGVPDECDIADGYSSDWNQNGIPDDCEPDCNDSGYPDDWDIVLGISQDCNDNGVPDECDIADETSSDVNGNGIPDECETDCNGNGVPDDWDLSSGTSADCNANGVPDECDIADETSSDVNGNGIPDECEVDCNENGVPDDWELSTGASPDCNANSIPDECDVADETSSDVNGNGIPDECETDCNGNGVPDDWDLLSGTSEDCNDNGVPDECDIAEGVSDDANENGIADECETDCNGNGVPDDWDLLSGTSEDCNDNGVPDECDIADGTAADFNENGIPDECDQAGREMTEEEYNCFMRGLVLLIEGLDEDSPQEDIECLVFALEVLAEALETEAGGGVDDGATPDQPGGSGAGADESGRIGPGAGVCPVSCGLLLSVAVAGLYWTRRRGGCR